MSILVYIYKALIMCVNNEIKIKIIVKKYIKVLKMSVIMCR